MTAPRVSIVIPTLRRPAPLAAAAASALAQTGVAGGVELVIVDNDPDGAARLQVAALAQHASIQVRYVHASEPGVANARNAGVAAARGDFIAFLDDDEIAPPGWAAALLSVQRRFDADAVFGPVRARLPDGPINHREHLLQFFSRLGPEEACTILDGPGCGCSLVRKDVLPHPTHPFSAERNGIGGEDDLLFAAMKQAGARFAWAPDAWVWEEPEPARLTLRYTLRRAFAYGQGPASAAAAKGGASWIAVPFWMGVGAAQAAFHGVRALINFLTRSPRLASSLDRLARGVGKVLWFPPFKIDFYGAGAPSIPTAPTLTDTLKGDAHERHQPLVA